MSDDDYELECTYCGGEGNFVGTDRPGFDYVNDDPNEIYDCPACKGTGERKHQTIW